MTETAHGRSPEHVVLALIRVVSGEAPLKVARTHLLDERVTLHMDSATYRGPAVWLIWVRLIRCRGRLRGLKLAPSEVRPVAGEPELVDLWMRWSGFDRRRNLPVIAPNLCHVRYRVRGGRVVAIWTSRSNYAFVLGDWVRHPLTHVLFKILAAFQCLTFKCGAA